MEVQEFVTSVLRQLENSLADAERQSAKMEFHFDKSVKFDLAVTHTANKDGDLGGEITAGIKIVDFEVGGDSKLSTGQEVVQRIQFSVNVWPKTSGTVVSSGNVSSMFNQDQDL